MLALAALAPPALAQCDPQRQPVTQVFDAHPLALLEFENHLYAGGASHIPGVGLARWDGHTWTNFAAPGMSSIYSIARDATSLIVGGPAGVKSWNGAAWTSLGTGIDPNRNVSALAVHDGEVFAGGTFRRIGGVDALRIAAWNGSAWRALDAGLNSQVMSLTSFRGELLAGGLFTQSGARMVKCIARWDGAQWQQLGPGTDGPVLAMIEYRGDLILGGRFFIAGGRTMNFICRWDGTQFHPMGGGLLARPGYEFITYVGGLTVFQGDLYAAGLFDLADGIPTVGMARWDGERWHAVQGTIDTCRTVGALGRHLVGAEASDDGWAHWTCPPCIADVDDDGLVDFSDYLLFLDLYRSGDPRADLTADGDIDRSDWLMFFGVYSAGCP